MIKTAVISLQLLLAFTSTFLYGQSSDSSKLEEEKPEFAEPIFFDTSTDIGGEPKELEINYVPSFDLKNGINFLSSSFEFEYVLFENFGIELEPGFTTFFGENDITTGLNDWELETQYTFKANRNFGIAGGIEFGLPVGNRSLGLSEGQFEIEPFVTTVFKTNFGLSVHPRMSVGFRAFELKNANQDIIEEPEEGLEYTGTLALLYTFENIFFGSEISGIYEDELTTIITPQIGWTINNFFLGTGFQVFVSEEGTRYGVISRLIYELEFGE